MSTKLQRRKFLMGAGTLLALPFLESTVTGDRTARADTPPSLRRFIAFHFPIDRREPRGVDAHRDRERLAARNEPGLAQLAQERPVRHHERRQNERQIGRVRAHGPHRLAPHRRRRADRHACDGDVGRPADRELAQRQDSSLDSTPSGVRRQLQQSLIDAVRDDAKRLQSRIGKNDHVRRPAGRVVRPARRRRR